MECIINSFEFGQAIRFSSYARPPVVSSLIYGMGGSIIFRRKKLDSTDRRKLVLDKGERQTVAAKDIVFSMKDKKERSSVEVDKSGRLNTYPALHAQKEKSKLKQIIKRLIHLKKGH